MTVNKVALLLLLSVLPLSAAEFTIVVSDPAGSGFNDPNPVSPIGGNTGTTLGEQRLNVLRRAMQIWGENLESNVPIVVDASMPSQICDAATGSAVLASAGATYGVSDFPNAPKPGIFYGPALSNALATTDLSTTNADIQVRVNINIDADSACAQVFGGWYYGYDFQNGNARDLLATLLHELGHGLGFQSFANSSTGALFQGASDTFTDNIFDKQTQKPWSAMTNAERVTSAENDPHLVWTGSQVTQEAPGLLQPNVLPLVQVNAPSPLAGKYEAFEAVFGPALSADITAEVVDANTNGCTPITNSLSGKIVLIDRGGCPFADKVAAAQAGGAVAVIIVNNTDSALFTMQGTGSVSIPSVFISMADGAELRAALPLSITLGRDPERAGMNGGHMRLHAPDPLVTGSSVSHFTESATPELLMEPNSSDDLSDDLDLTLALFHDLGWNLIQTESVYRHIYPWLSHNSSFESTLIANNTGVSAADVTLTARRATGDAVQVTAQIPAYGFLEETVTNLFPTLAAGGGFTVELTTDSPNVNGRWVTLSLLSPSQASPSQGEAIALPASSSKRTDGKAGSGNNLLYGYLPNTGTILSAPVIVNVGDAPANVTLYFFDEQGQLLKTDTTSIQNLQPFRPFAAIMDTLIPGQKVNMTVVARSASQPIAGAAFIFDSTFLEPSIGSAQVLENFTAP